MRSETVAKVTITRCPMEMPQNFAEQQNQGPRVPLLNFSSQKPNKTIEKHEGQTSKQTRVKAKPESKLLQLNCSNVHALPVTCSLRQPLYIPDLHLRTVQNMLATWVFAIVLLSCGSAANVVSISNLDLATLADPTGFKLLGSTQYGSVGYCVSTAGDVNGDGFNDILIGEPYGGVGYSSTGTNGQRYYNYIAGVVYVIFGRSNGIPFNNIDLNTMATGPNVGYRINGQKDGFNNNNGQLGFSVSKAGDFNGDGVGDILVGGATETTTNPYANRGGAAYVLFGNKNSSYAADINLQTMVTGRYTGFRIFGTGDSEYIGSSVGAAGDINGDGVDDIIIGALFKELGQQGATFVLFGRRVYTNGAAFTNVNLATFSFTAATGFRVSGYRNGATVMSTGWGTSSAGDVNNDGVGDIIICGRSGTAAYVIYGRNTTGSVNLFSNIALLDWVTSNTTGFRLFGTWVYTANTVGDVNGDGIPDIVVGTIRYLYPMSVYVIFGRDVATRGAFADITVESFITGFSTGFKVVGGPVNTNSGRGDSGNYVGTAGDVNGDGISDMIVGFDQGDIRLGSTSRGNSGTSYVLFGRNTTLTGLAFTDFNVTNFRADISVGYCIYGAHSSALSGSSVSSAGDINNDGFGDIIVGASNDKGTGTSTYSGFGAAYVIYGANYIPMPTAAPTIPPTRLPSRTPTYRPTNTPIARPTAEPTIDPTASPSEKPTSLPSSQPSAHPSSQPSALPSTQPTTQPTALPTSFPTAQPTGSPSAQPILLPTTQPTSQPSSQPSAQPTTLPTLLPSTQPTSQPTSQPSTQPSSVPSIQPTIQPTSAPTTQPTAQPSTQPVQRPTALPTVLPLPTSQPSSHPSDQPTSQPTTRPSVQPTDQPTLMPSNQPSAQPTTQPSSVPSVYPTSTPTSTSSWVALFENTTLHRLSVGLDTVWACGEDAKAGCVVLDASTGGIHEQYMFEWDGIVFVTAVHAMQTVFVGGTITVPQVGSTSPLLHSVIGTCSIDATTGLRSDITCAVKSYANVDYAHSTYSTFANRVLFVGNTYMHAAAMIVDPTATTAAASKSYLYSAANMKSIMLHYTCSPPRFVGSMVVGTAVSVGNMHCIVAGWINLDTGSMNAMYITPVTGMILGSDSLVTGMVVEPLGPDMFIVGGMEQSSDSRGVSAYLVRANALYRSMKYSVRYVTSDVGNRRSLRGNVADSSVCRGVVRANDDLFILLDYTTSDTSAAAVILRVASDSGDVVDEAVISAHNASITCTDIVISTKGLLHIVCAVQYVHSTPQAAVVATTTELRFTRVPHGFDVRTGNRTFYAENIALRATYLSVTKQSMAVATTVSTVVTGNQAPTYHPSVPPTPLPTRQPTLVPSIQPTTTPTTTPTVSPQPTGQPSTSGPTNTYKPIATPTTKPTRVPTIQRTAHPTTTSTTQPTLRPSSRPTLMPTTRPTAASTTKPTTAPSVVKTHYPSTVRTIRPTRAAPSARPTAAVTDVQQNASVGADGRDNTSRIMYIVFASFGGTVCVLFLGSMMWKVYSNQKQKSGKRFRRAAYDRAYAGLKPRWFSSHKSSTPAPSVRHSAKLKSSSAKGTRVLPSALGNTTTGVVVEGSKCEQNLMQPHVVQTLVKNNPNDVLRVDTNNSRDSADSLYDEILREGSDYSYSESDPESE